MYMFIVVMILFLMFSILYCLSFKMKVNENFLSSYECGFEIISKSRVLFSFRFFLIAVLFLVFDVEIVLMLAIPIIEMNYMLMMSFFMFMVVLLVGVVYELYYGSLRWAI